MLRVLLLLVVNLLTGCVTERDTNPVNAIDFGWGLITNPAPINQK